MILKGSNALLYGVLQRNVTPCSSGWLTVLKDSYSMKLNVITECSGDFSKESPSGVLCLGCGYAEVGLHAAGQAEQLKRELLSKIAETKTGCEATIEAKAQQLTLALEAADRCPCNSQW